MNTVTEAVTLAPHLAQPEAGMPLAQFIRIRRDLHANPELGFSEHRTAAMVAELLSEWGYSVTTGIGGTGVVGQLQRGHGGRRLGLRADMDALPVHEKTGVAWASTVPGVMHACGHDGHTATLLAAARAIAQSARFEGTVNLIFQPAEEGAGGAVRMIDDGLFDRFPCDAVFAMHNLPGLATGSFMFRSGPTMASSDDVTVHLNGVGGHGAMPHTTTDVIVAASSIVLSLQSVVARNVDPLETAVVSVGALHAGQAGNVIPDRATLELSVRALNAEVRALLRRRIVDIVDSQARGLGVEAVIDWRPGYDVLVNDAHCTRFASDVALSLFGSERVVTEGRRLTASEDFAFMLQKVPGCYFFVGNGLTGQPGGCMVHNPGYDFNDHIIEPVSRFWVAL
ncbi:MAG: amidohydrolase, partial [Betaproteobacteria bacterium]|nr:amidohydrolase [Betaproteobacteria bacterium]